MESQRHIGALFTVLCLGLYIGFSNGQDKCIKLYQNGVSVVNDQTELVCHVTDKSHHFVLMLDVNGMEIAFIERQHGKESFVNPCPDQYDCEWDNAQRALVVRIPKTTSEERGTWTCSYYGKRNSTSLCINALKLDVNVIGKSTEYFTLQIANM